MNKKINYILGFILVVLFSILLFLVSNNMTLKIDKNIFDFVILLKNNFIDGFLFIITNIGSTKVVLFILVIIALILFRKNLKKYCFYLFTNVSVGVFLMVLIKNLVKRVRPSWKWITQGGYSFPSGHTITAVLLYGSLIYIINKNIKVKSKTFLNIINVLLIIMIPFSRIYFGVHYFTDIIGALLLGITILLITTTYMEKDKNDKN